MLKRFGGDPNEVDQADREILHRYFLEHFRLGQPTGVNLPSEISGRWFEPTYNWQPNHLYATMTFGQSITVTPLQLVAAYAALFNGGTYYQPYLVHQIGENVYEPRIEQEGILSPETLADLELLMDEVGARNLTDMQITGLKISGKTGTAQVSSPEGGYLDDAANGLMFGYVKSRQRTLIVGVIVYEPQVRFAGAQGARPIWKEIIRNLIAEGQIY